jgi:glycosyltransferase involved in cell wall biosynthesis
LAASLEGAALVIAESVAAAKVAVEAGADGARLWVLALPPERLRQDAPSEYGADVAALAPQVGGFLADSEPARDAVERAAAAGRPRVEIFPPLAVDRPCPSCPSPSAEPGKRLPPEVEQLSLWRGLIEAMRAGRVGEVPYSFPAARLLGLGAQWTPAGRPDWTQESDKALRGPVEAQPDTWSAKVQERTARAVLRAVVPAHPATPRRTRRVVVSGFDLKFARELAGRLNSRTDLDVTLDEWPSLAEGSRDTEALVTSADSIFAEWARPSAVWLSRRKRPGQVLVVRLHRYELDFPYPREIDMDAVDAVVHVSPPIARRIREELGWPAEKLVYIPNFLDVDWLDRPKLPDARFGIGFVGMDFANKRFDLALDVLAEVRRHDPRFTLFVRSTMPWDNVYAWARPEEREYVGWCFERLERDPLLRGAVVFDPPGRDMARWYRRVGHVLSMSDIESFHLAVAEGMASGAVPVIRPWPGATEIYGAEWIHGSVEDAAAAVLASADEAVWAERAARARAEIRQKVDPELVVRAWADLLHGDVAGARSCFAAYLGS